MVIKKRGFNPEQEGEDPDSQDTQQRIKHHKSSILSIWCLLKEGWLEDPFVQSMLEGRFRKMVRKVTEPIVSNYLQTNPRSLGNVAEQSKSRKYKLHFDGQLPRVLYTENRIEGEGSLPLTLKLLDAQSGNVVTDSPLSFAKVKIVTLNGDFKIEMLEDWTHKEFDKHIVLPRPKANALLLGECVSLCNGICSFKGFRFYDNSSWVKSKMFRLGATIVAKEDQVREAVSCPFRVKHRRGESNQKPKTLTTNDEVWRLEGIAKNRIIHERLKEHQIYKVGDLLQQYHTNKSLCNIVGSSKAWKAIVQQVTKFFPNNECTYMSDCPPSFLASLPSFNLFSAAVATEVQPEVQLPKTHGMEASYALENEPDLDTAIDNSMIFSADFVSSIIEDNLSLQSVFEQATTSTALWGTLSCVDLGASTSNTAKPKRRFWSKIRAVWKFLLLKYGCYSKSLKKGKSTCISYYYC